MDSLSSGRDGRNRTLKESFGDSPVPSTAPMELVEGVEPPTLALQRRRSDQLSYTSTKVCRAGFEPAILSVGDFKSPVYSTPPTAPE